ncbi:hypothetical protein C8F04DRAFT_578734 [Mycena alexandri]|uniref:Uncharacterized protein n=1 Tax=Mycena alexandri TaxID=1745969 RepID=A0AAD6X3K1_9AGAR|nr:hypothetical protein C8F04DRAFT_578734 [Mycena alexandri]
MGYSLWLLPGEPQRSALAWVMAYRPTSYRENRQSYSSKSFPDFDPHITLANFSLPSPPSLDVLLPPKLDRVFARFKSLHVGNSYLGSLSVTIEKTSDLMTLHDAIDAHLRLNNIENRGGRFPHMSLFYLDEAVLGDRRRLPERLQRRGLVTSKREGVLLNSFPDGDPPVSLSGFDGEEIWLMDCNGPVAEWKMLDKRHLSFFDTGPAMHPPPPSYASPVVPPIGKNHSHRDYPAPFPATGSNVPERQQSALPPRQAVHRPMPMPPPLYASPVVPPIGKNHSHRDYPAPFPATGSNVPERQQSALPPRQAVHGPMPMPPPLYASPVVPPIGKDNSHRDYPAPFPATGSNVPERQQSALPPRQAVHRPMPMPQIGNNKPHRDDHAQCLSTEPRL